VGKSDLDWGGVGGVVLGGGGGGVWWVGGVGGGFVGGGGGGGGGGVWGGGLGLGCGGGGGGGLLRGEKCYIGGNVRRKYWGGSSHPARTGGEANEDEGQTEKGAGRKE